TLLEIVPENIFFALSDADILGLIFVSVIFGFAVSSMVYSEEKQFKKMGDLLHNITDSLSEMTFRVLNGILHYAPIGIFGIAANAIGSQGLQTLLSLGKLTGAIYIAIALQFILVYILFLRLFGVKVIQFFRDTKEAITTAFMTTSSLRSEERRVGKECRSRVAEYVSSRRRHTISKRDWSSDVCSSDLSQGLQTLLSLGKLTGAIYIAIALQFILVYILFLRLFGVKVIQFFRDTKEAITTAFMTTSSL